MQIVSQDPITRATVQIMQSGCVVRRLTSLAGRAVPFAKRVTAQLCRTNGRERQSTEKKKSRGEGKLIHASASTNCAVECYLEKSSPRCKESCGSELIDNFLRGRFHRVSNRSAPILQLLDVLHRCQAKTSKINRQFDKFQFHQKRRWRSNYTIIRRRMISNDRSLR